MKTELVKLSGHDRRLCLAFQFTLSKLLFEKQQFSKMDYEQLWLMGLHFIDTANEKLPKKLKGHKLSLTLILRFLGTNDLQSCKKKSQIHNLHFYCRNLLLDSSEYFGLKHGLFKTELSKITFKILPKKLYKPAPYIGVGYKDKGNTGNPAINGVVVTDLIKAYFPDERINFYEIDFNTSFDIVETCEIVDNAIEDHLLDF